MNYSPKYSNNRLKIVNFGLFRLFHHYFFYYSDPVTEYYCNKIHSSFRIIEEDFYNLLWIIILESEDILPNDIGDLNKGDILVGFNSKAIVFYRYRIYGNIYTV